MVGWIIYTATQMGPVLKKAETKQVKMKIKVEGPTPNK